MGQYPLMFFYHFFFQLQIDCGLKDTDFKLFKFILAQFFWTAVEELLSFF